ncbi:MAG: sodium:proton antiporter [Desulfocapsaceae bacterium]|nr:sodium:proton antiporter [Desulfocapsaceae bacterium]
MTLNTISLIAFVFVFCAICQWTAWRVRLPPILFLLLTGIIAGPVLGLVNPEEFLGELFFPFVSFSVAIILFEGSLTLKISEIKGLHVVVRNMVSLGMAVSWLITTLGTKIIFDVSWEVATLFGAIMVVTGPTVVAPILRTVRPISSIANILKWESIVIDPIGASLAVLVYEFIIIGGGQEALGHTFINFAQLLVIGSLIGVVAGYLFGLSLRYYLIPEFLQNICALGVVFSIYALADLIQAESGLVTVTVFGFWLANMRGVDLEHILAFKETLSILLISLLFIVLAARINFIDLQELGWGALFICLVIQLLARPINVMVSTLFANISQAEKNFMAWVAPRGIVAAAISSLFALKLTEYGYEDADLLVPLTFVVIIFTVLLQSLTAVPLARILGVNLPEPEGFLIIGANRLARAIATALLKNDIKVMLTDSSWERIAEAEKEGIPTYRGNPLSEHAEYNLQLVGLGTLLALSAYESENIAAAFHYRQEFGKNNIFTLPASKDRGSSKKRGRPQTRGILLFDSKASYAELAEMFEQGATIKQFTLQKKIDLDDFHEKYGKEAIPLFAIDPENTAHCFNKEQLPGMDEGWKILYLGYDGNSG